MASDEYVLVKRTDLERMLMEIQGIKAIVAEEVRLSRLEKNKPSAQASPSA